MKTKAKIVGAVLLVSLVASLTIFSIVLIHNETTNGSKRSRDTYSRFAFLEMPKADFVCPGCQKITTMVDELYASGEYPFYYVLLPEENAKASARTKELNLWGYPTIYIDGGYDLIVGSNIEKSFIAEKIVSAANSLRPNITESSTAELSQNNGTIKLTILLSNNESHTYTGQLRIYLTEINFTTDQGSQHTHFSVIDIPIDELINISKKGNVTIEQSVNITGLDAENLMVFSVVFNEEAHIRYSQPPDKNQFDAHYVDAVNVTTIKGSVL